MFTYVIWTGQKKSALKIYAKCSPFPDAHITLGKSGTVTVECDHEAWEARIIEDLVGANIDPNKSYSREALISAFKSSKLDTRLAGNAKLMKPQDSRGTVKKPLNNSVLSTNLSL